MDKKRMDHAIRNLKKVIERSKQKDYKPDPGRVHRMAMRIVNKKKEETIH